MEEKESDRPTAHLAQQLAEARAEIDEWKSHEAAARGAVFRLARLCELDEEYISRFMAADYESALRELEGRDD